MLQSIANQHLDCVPPESQQGSCQLDAHQFIGDWLCEA